MFSPQKCFRGQRSHYLQNGGHWEAAKVLIYICTFWVGLPTPALNNVGDLPGADCSSDCFDNLTCHSEASESPGSS